MRVRRMCCDDVRAVVLIEQAVHEAPWTSGNFMDALDAGYDAWVFEPHATDEAVEADGEGMKNDGNDRNDNDRNDVDSAPESTRSGLPTAKMVGYAIVMWLPGEVHLLNLAVCASWQGQGKGRAILHWLLRNARNRGANAMMLEVRPSNARATALYHSAGFAQIGLRRNYYPARNGREDALVLRKRFGSA